MVRLRSVPDPFASVALVAHESATLPFVQDAFRCHHGRFRSVANGLSELEAATLMALRRGPRRFGALFQEVTALPHLRRHGMGDVQFAACLRALTSVGEHHGRGHPDGGIGHHGAGPPGRGRGRWYWLALHPIDTWLGAIDRHPGGPLWRWDGARGRLVTALA